MEIVIGKGVPFSEEQLLDSRAFQRWLEVLPEGRHQQVIVNDVDFWGGDIHSLHVTSDGKRWAERFTLRSETVNVLTIVTDGKRRLVVFVGEYRASVGRVIKSNVAGGIGANETARQAAEREVLEEADVPQTAEVVITKLLPSRGAASPGVTGELVHSYKAVVTMTAEELDEYLGSLETKRTGLAEEGEELTVEAVPYDKALAFALGTYHDIHDSKTVEALACDLVR